MIVLLLLTPALISAVSICSDTASCIARIREVVAEPKRFWFGEHRRTQCAHRHANAIDCFGPAHLSNFHSVGSRLFRVRTYHSAYLRNLILFPRITYRGAPGHYRACEHEFHSNNSNPIEADPLMKPVNPFEIRNKPEIDWAGLQYNDEYILVMTDVGFGTLNYFSVDFPYKTKVLKEYEPSDNFRSLPNPLVLLVFKKGDRQPNISNTEDFNLVDFMTEYSLEDNLVGMNLVVVGSDPFAIERQRMRGNVDNCHSLLQQKLREYNPTKLFNQLETEDISQWLSVSFNAPEMSAEVCCHRIEQKETKAFLDPLGEQNTSALSTLSPPSFTSLRVVSTASSFINYHRHTRTYLALMDDLFTLLLVDGNSGKLHWMLVDISASELGTDGEKGITKAAYLPLTPADPATCRPFVFVLLEQSGSLSHLQPYCSEECIERKEFNIEPFRQQYGLRLVALSWMNSCYDLQYAYHILRQSMSALNGTGEPTRTPKRQSDTSAQICTAFKVASFHRCRVSSAQSTSLLLVILIVFFSFSQRC